jgi:hypothetical protein
MKRHDPMIKLHNRPHYYFNKIYSTAPNTWFHDLLDNGEYDDSALIKAINDLQNQINDKVDKVNGKQLSTNDYTTAEKNKLAGLSNYTVAQETIYGVVKARTISTYDTEMPEDDFLSDSIDINTSNVEKFLKANVYGSINSINISNKVGCPIKLYITEFSEGQIYTNKNKNTTFLLPKAFSFVFWFENYTDSICIYTEKLTVVNV